MKSIFVVLIVSISQYGWCQSYIQGGIVSAYNQSDNNNYSAEWTIGEIINETFSTDNFTVSSGLTESTLVITNIQEHESFQMRSFPNPFSRILSIESSKLDFKDLKFDFIDALGKRIEIPVLSMQKESVSFFTEDLKSGLYILIIKSKDKTPLVHIKLIRE